MASQRSTPFLQIAMVALPALALWISQVSDLLKVAFSPFPFAASYFEATISILLSAATWFVVMAKEKVKGISFSTLGDVVGSEPMFPRAARLTAGILLPILLLGAFRSIWETLPNVLLGRKIVSGYLCDRQTLKPLPKLNVSVTNKFGFTVSESGTASDRDGFFIATLKGWATRPQFLEIESGASKSTKLLFSDGFSSNNYGCPERLPENLRTTPSNVWLLILAAKNEGNE